MKELKTVGELIDYLETLGRERLLLADDSGNTQGVTTDDIALWNETSDDPISPVAIFIANLSMG